MAETKQLSELEKLRVLIPHWLEHNHGHQHEFEKWVAVAKKEGQAAAAAALEQALAELARADEYLRKALDLLGGQIHGHHHGHHHHGH